MDQLELGLALPNHDPMMTVKGLNLNSRRNNNGVEIEKRNAWKKHHIYHDEEEVESKNLSLLLWSGQPNEEDDDRKLHQIDINDDDDEENQEIVGWPPINSMRKELLHHGGWVAEQRAANNRDRNRNRAAARNSKYVKVKMEGVPIGRKIDLRLYNCYQDLTHALIHMFAKYTKNDSRDGDYTILYQDKEGDWMLAGDVPWETFIESVQRIEILRNGN